MMPKNSSKKRIRVPGREGGDESALLQGPARRNWKFFAMQEMTALFESVANCPESCRKLAFAVALLTVGVGPVVAAGDTGALDRDVVLMPIAQASESSPSSRDDLFGLSAAPDIARSQDAPKDGNIPRFAGFYDFELAYSYNGPAHWSRAVNRLNVTLEDDLGGGVKWKLGGRVDVDPVYMFSDFYLSDVKQNQRASAFWGENYLDFTAGGWDFRIGAQQIVWGEVVGVFVADVVSALDRREFLLPSFDIIRIPQWAARAEYFFKGDTHVELIWIPVPAFDRIGKPGADFYQVVFPGKPSASEASLFLDPVKPSRSLSNGDYGVRANTLVQGWDLAAFFYRSFNSQPTFYLVNQQPAQPAYVYQPRYDRISQAGGTFGKDFGAYVLRGEAVYTSVQNYALADPFAAPDGVAQRRALNAIVGLDFSPSTDSRVNIQLFNRTLFGGGDTDLALKTAGWGGSILASMKFGAFEPQILWIQSFNDAGGLVRPRLAWTGVKNATFAVGVDVFTGPKDGFFGRYGDRDRLYTEMRYDF
jgi:hypothetical protein